MTRISLEWLTHTMQENHSKINARMLTRFYDENSNTNARTQVHHFPWHKDFSSSKDSNLVMSQEAGSVEAVRVDVIKGRTMMMRREALQSRLGLVFDHTDTRGDDIAVSGSLAQGQSRRHLIPRLFHRRLVELPAPHALCDVEGHYERREAVRRRFFLH